MKNKYLVLVNKNHECPDLDLEITKTNSEYKEESFLERETYEAFLKLKDFIKTQGYTIDVESGYRSKKHQQELWDEILILKGLEHTKRFVAFPGYSEHQTGLAVDFCLKEDKKFLIDFEMTGKKVLEIVANNAYKYGFILRYPKGKENITGYGYEPWHLRYIKDKDIAKYIKEENITLEEFLERK